ncbi:citrate synthase [bacterium]|nr:MAG: citrate synthase [bacterium]
MGFLTTTTTEHKYSPGLEGVIAAISGISAIDGEEGKLIYRGIPIEVLAKNSTFEETAYLLLFSDLPTQDELENFKMDLVEHRELPENLLDLLNSLPRDSHPMEVLRTSVSFLGHFCPDKDKDSRGANIRKALRIIAKIPGIIAAWARIREGKNVIPHNPDLPHAANFLYMLHGERRPEDEEKIFDVCLILHADHGMNASTFAAMVTASTLSDIYSAIVSAIGTLKGPLHGGANERVLYMLDEIGSVDRAEEYVLDALAHHRKIMGFGHRVYKSYDPRARILKEYAKSLSEKNNDMRYFEIGDKIEEVMIREVGKKGIFPNVDFYSGIVYHFLGIPRDLFTPIFAMARVVGWSAHVLEYLQANRIFRPRAIYSGPIDREYIPIEKRSG